MAKEAEWKEWTNKRMDIDYRIRQNMRELENERRRRQKHDDDFRQPIMDKFEFGKVGYAHIPYQEPWQLKYLDIFGKHLKLHENWRCPRCGEEYGTAYPPIGGCAKCREMDGKFTPTPIDDLIRARAFKR